MEKSVEIQAQSVDLAVEKALLELGVKKEDVVIEVLEKSSLFTQARVKVTVVEKENLKEDLEKFLNGVLDRMSLVSRVTIEDKDDTFFVEIKGSDTNVVIGHRGETLDSFQYLAITFLNAKKADYKKVVVDAENYRSRREETLKELAIRTAEKAERLQRKIALEPMSAAERRIIHSALADNDSFQTESDGEEPNRFVIIIPVAVELKDEKVLKNSDNNNKHRKDDRNKKGYSKNNNKKSYKDNDEEVEDGQVFRGLYSDDFQKPQPQGGAPKFKSFGGKKF